MKSSISGFRDKNIGKPEPWDGEDEAVFKTWLEKLTAHMAGAGDKVWKKVIKHIGEMDEDDNLEAEEDVENMMIDLKINPDLADEMQDMLCDQLTQYTRRSFLLTFKSVDLNKVWSLCGRRWRTARRRQPRTYIAPEIG